jgi:hypothetical protein
MFEAGIAQSQRHYTTFPHRGFVLWRLSDDGPGAGRIAAKGRHPKPFTGADITEARLDHLVDEREQLIWSSLLIRARAQQ